MNGGHVQALLFMLNRPEPLRQSSLLMVLATGIGHAPSLMAGLKALAQESNPPWSTKVEQLRALLAEGQTLSEALTITTDLLPEESLVAIRVAEQAGSLKQVLAEEAHRLMETGTSGNSVQPTIPMTFVWLVLLGCIAMSIIAFVMVFIIPKFKAIFEGFGVALPDMTVGLINISDWFMNYWYITAFPAACIMVYLTFLLLKGSLRFVQCGHVLWSEHFPRFWTPMILRLLSVTVSAEKPLGEGVHAILSELQPGKASRELSGVRQRIHAGVDCWKAMQMHGFLKPRELAFLESSAKTRHLDWGLLHLARTIEQRRVRWASILSTLLQPVIILLIGAVVGFVVVAMFKPLVELIIHMPMKGY